MLTGIDVSKWQGAIGWPAVAGAGAAFAICKASERPPTGAVHRTPVCWSGRITSTNGGQALMALEPEAA